MTSTRPMDRRAFLKAGAVAGGGLLLIVYAPEVGALGAGRGSNADDAGAFAPNAFVKLDPDGTITITVARSDMGQGVRTALPMVVADELDADWSNVRIVQADAHPDRFGRMMTVGSTSVRNGSWDPLRKAGAAGREMLIGAAAALWSVSPSSLRTERGRVHHDASKRSASYGELAERASTIPVPQDPTLKKPDAFSIIGTSPLQLDVPDKVTGRAHYGIDARPAGMRFATVVHPPVFGSKVKSFDATKARAVSGVRDVVQLTTGIAVVADHTWAAFQGARALDITYENDGFTASSDEIFKSLSALADAPGIEATRTGDVDAAMARASAKLDATYEAPYLAHATMEPMNCTADVRSDRVEVWAPTQNPQGVQQAAARFAGVPLDKSVVHVQLLGCGWGRRSSTDFVQDALETSKAIGGPVQVVWTREEDMQHDFYRPAAHVRLTGGLSADGKLVAARVRVAAQPISGGRNGIDSNAVAAIADTPYTIPNYHVEYCKAANEVPVGYWRSVGPSQNTFIFESFIDELAAHAKRDPVEFRLELLANDPRMHHVLTVAAERAKWGSAVPAGHARGVALLNDRGGRVAEVAEVSLERGRIRIHKVTLVADCGQIIHPRIVAAQMSGSVVAGLSAALYGEITIEKGRVKQGNFNNYRMLRMDEMPEVDVFVVPSHEEPGGVGEPGVPPIAAAVSNALFTLTGVRARRLPLKPELFSQTVGEDR